jgi:hypothetical protein
MKAESKTKKRWRAKGLAAAAALLNVTPVHLSYVIHGRRKSRVLLRKYRELCGETINDEC